LYYNTLSYELPFDASDDLFQKTYTIDEIDTLYELFDTFIGSQLKTNIVLRIKCNSSSESDVVSRNILEQFINKLFTNSCPKILQSIQEIQQLYLLHIFSILLIKCNEEKLHLDDDAFFNVVYLPNLVFICSKLFIKMRRFIGRLLNNTCIDIEHDMKDVISYSNVLTVIDLNVMKTDVMDLFFKTVVSKFDPISLLDPNSFYSLLFHKIVFYYLKLRVKKFPDDKFNETLIQDNVMSEVSERSRIYGEAIYLAQIQEMCRVSSTTKRVFDCYDRLKSIVIPHELQKLFVFALNKGRHMVNNNKMILAYANRDAQDVTFFKQKTPNIYRLLKAVHVKSDYDIIPPENFDSLRTAVYTILYDRFRDILSYDTLSAVIHNISNDVVFSLFVGDFIDVTTMTKIQVSKSKVIDELPDFFDCIFNEFNN
jgi:hypothetical protein